MPHSVKETLTIGWCDNGLVEGRFASNLMSTVLSIQKDKIDVNTVRVNGNQIARQRQVLFDAWKQIGTDWLLWIDSDIVITKELFKRIWDTADKKTKPVVSGVYFVSTENEQSLMEPLPAIYMETGYQFLTSPIHPMPIDKVIPVDITGFGLILMHKSIIEPIEKAAEGYSVFGELQNPGEKFVSEDVSFCRYLKKAGIQLYAHTGAIAAHLKTFSYDQNYYYVYWKGVQDKLIMRKGDPVPEPEKKDEE